MKMQFGRTYEYYLKGDYRCDVSIYENKYFVDINVSIWDKEDRVALWSASYSQFKYEKLFKRGLFAKKMSVSKIVKIQKTINKKLADLGVEDELIMFEEEGK